MDKKHLISPCDCKFSVYDIKEDVKSTTNKKIKYKDLTSKKVLIIDADLRNGRQNQISTAKPVNTWHMHKFIIRHNTCIV